MKSRQTSVTEPRSWAERAAKLKSPLTAAGIAGLAAGEHCRRCKLPPAELSDEEIAHALARLLQLKSRTSNATAHAYL